MDLYQTAFVIGQNSTNLNINNIFPSNDTETVETELFFRQVTSSSDIVAISTLILLL